MARTKVKTPDGIVTVDHPEGATEEQILGFARQQHAARGVTVGPPEPGNVMSNDRDFLASVREQFEAGNPSFIESLFTPGTLNVTPEQGRAGLPILAGTAASLFSGGIVPSALLFGAGAGGGELLGNTVGGNATLGDVARTGVEGTRDALIGGVAVKALSPLARFVFGRAATPEGEAALEFARRRSSEMADEAFHGTRAGDAVPSAAADAMERGAPRIALDSITDGTLLDGAKMLVSGARPANVRATQAAQFINRELASFTGNVPKTSSVVQDAKSLVFADDSLRSLRQFDRFDGDRWVDEVVTGANETALAQLARSSPEVHRQILAKNLENTINSFSRNSPELGLKVLDGRGLNKWVADNKSDILRIYGFGTYRKLSDFTNYAQHLDTTIAQAEKGLGGSLGVGGTILRTGMEAGGMGFLPKVVLPLQGSAWVLGNTLMNPSSATFQFFAALPKAGRAIRPAAMAGAAALDAGPELPEDPRGMFGGGY